MKITEAIKMLLKRKKLKQNVLIDLWGLKNKSSLSTKLRRNAMDFEDFKQVIDLLGYDISLRSRTNGREIMNLTKVLDEAEYKKDQN